MTTAVRRPFRLTPPVVLEHPLQRQIANVLRLEIAPAGKVSRLGVVWWSCDITDYAADVPGTRVDRGLIAGVPDLFVLSRGLAFMIEIKTEDGALSPAQQSVCAAVLAGAGRVAVCVTVDQVLAALDAWQIPRARRVRTAA
jgi:hypothetical protein